MFIVSMRASSLRFLGIAAVALVVMVTLIAFVPVYSPVLAVSAEGAQTETGNEVVYSGVRSAADAVNFLSQFGWQVTAEPKETEEVTIPAEFDKVFAGYNEIQKQQGLDLSRYKKKTVTRYTFIVNNYPGYTGTVYANVLVLRGKVIGGDICTADVSGFLHGFEKTQP